MIVAHNNQKDANRAGEWGVGANSTDKTEELSEDAEFLAAYIQVVTVVCALTCIAVSVVHWLIDRIKPTGDEKLMEDAGALLTTIEVEEHDTARKAEQARVAQFAAAAATALGGPPAPPAPSLVSQLASDDDAPKPQRASAEAPPVGRMPRSAELDAKREEDRAEREWNRG